MTNKKQHLPMTSTSLVSLSVSFLAWWLGTSGSRLTGFCGDKMPAAAAVTPLNDCSGRGASAALLTPSHCHTNTNEYSRINRYSRV